MATAMTMYPELNEVFEMTLDGGAPENQPMAMVKGDYGSSEGWKHKGSVVEGVLTKRFKLVQIGYCPNWQTVLDKLKKHGEIPKGQWREAFKRQFPTVDGKGPIGFADASWVGPHGYARFPYVGSDGSSHFYWTDDDFIEYWRWLAPSR